MIDDIEHRLRQVRTRGAPPELRPRVLAAVAEQLRPATPLPSRRPFRPALAVAAALLASLGLNFWVNDRLDRRLAIVFGPPPLHRQAAGIAADVASITDPTTGQWVYDRLVRHRPGGDSTRQYGFRLQQVIQQFTVDLKETADETPRENSQMDRDRHGSRDYDPADAQCLLRVEYRHRA
jgi:hypothetical protein